MKNNHYLESITVEELQQRQEFTVVPEWVSCDLKCLGVPDDTIDTF